mgnify:FL=1
MITTKKGKEEGLNVTVNSSTMFAAGYLRKPEVQTSYSSGSQGTYLPEDMYGEISWTSGVRHCSMIRIRTNG